MAPQSSTPRLVKAQDQVAEARQPLADALVAGLAVDRVTHLDQRPGKGSWPVAGMYRLAEM